MQCAKTEAKHTRWFIAFSANASIQGIEFPSTRVASPGNNFSYFLHNESVGKVSQYDLAVVFGGLLLLPRMRSCIQSIQRGRMFLQLIGFARD
jgi:hypothetical protein